MDLFNLAAKLSLDSKGFTDGLKKADKQGQNFAKKLTKSFNTISKVAKTVLGGVVVKQVIGSITSLANATATFGDRIDKSAQRLGLSYKAYQQWDWILRQNGGSIDGLNMSMKTLNSHIDELSDPQKREEATKLFQSIGVDPDLLLSLDAENRFDYIINAFQQLPDGVDKTTKAYELFGKGADDLIPTLNQSSEELYALKDRASELGLYMSDEGVKQSVAYGDALDEMKATFTSLKNAIVVDILPYLTDALKQITGWAASIKKAYEEGGVAGVFSKLAEDIKAAFDKIWLNIRANISWEKLKKIGSDIIEKISSGITQIKVNLAERLGMTDESGNPLEPSSITWTGIGKAVIANVWTGVQEWNNTAKGWLADKLGFTEEEKNSATWIDIGKAVISEVWNGISEWSNTAKGWLSVKLGIDAEAKETSWIDIGKTIIKTVYDGISGWSNDAKGWLISKLGIDSEVSGTSWFDIGRVIIGRIWNGLQGWSNTAKNWLATKLGITSEENGTDWLTIGKNIIGRISDGVQTFSYAAKNWLADRLGFTAEEKNGLAWSRIGWSIMNKIKTAIMNWSNGSKNWLAVKLGLTNSSGEIDASWGDIGKELVNKMFAFLGTGGSFLKKLILGSDFTDKSTWSDVADKVFGWITEALEGKDLIGTLFEKAADKTSGIITFAGNVLGAVVDWLGDHSDRVVNVISTILTKVVQSASSLITQLVPVLVKLITDPELLEGIGKLAGTLMSEIIKLLSDPETYQKIVEAIIAIVKGVKDALAGVIETFAEENGLTNKVPTSKKNINAKELRDFLGLSYIEAGWAYDGYMTNEQIDKERVKAIQQLLKMDTSEYAEAVGISEEKAEAELEKFKKMLEELTGKTWEVALSLNYEDPEAGIHGVEPKGSKSIPGHAKGLWDVPYDNYLASLHRGERVLTASQARHYDGGGASAGDIAAAVKAAVSEAMANLSITLDKKIVGKVMGDTVSSRVHDNINFANAQTAYSHGR